MFLLNCSCHCAAQLKWGKYFKLVLMHVEKINTWYVGITVNITENMSDYPLAQTVICALTQH